jgi:hypothetical protein
MVYSIPVKPRELFLELYGKLNNPARDCVLECYETSQPIINPERVKPIDIFICMLKKALEYHKIENNATFIHADEETVNIVFSKETDLRVISYALKQEPHSQFFDVPMTPPLMDADSVLESRMGMES